MVKISVIIPVFGVESFVGRCVDSLLGQSLEEGIEFIFVDDASKDGSRSIIESKIAQYPNRLKQVKIITHECNKGLPAARNTGLLNSVGKYIVHVDGDDYVDHDMFEKMLMYAEQSQVDYLWCDWFLCYGERERLMKQPYAESPEKALKLMLTGKLKHNVWNKLVKRSLYFDNEIFFPEGYSMGEDMTMIRLLSKAESVCHIDYAWYHYVKINSGAMTASYQSNALCDLKYNVSETVNYIRSTNVLLGDTDEILSEFKLASKFHFLFSKSEEEYRIWNDLWPESNLFISKKNGIRAWLLQKSAQNHIWIVLKLHFMIYNSIYKLFYK